MYLLTYSVRRNSIYEFLLTYAITKTTLSCVLLLLNILVKRSIYDKVVLVMAYSVRRNSYIDILI